MHLAASDVQLWVGSQRCEMLLSTRLTDLRLTVHGLQAGSTESRLSADTVIAVEVAAILLGVRVRPIRTVEVARHSAVIVITALQRRLALVLLDYS